MSIGTAGKGIQIIQVVPIGTILPWHKNLTGTPSLPDDWAECNGQTISDENSPYNGEVIPNLNGAAAGDDLNNGDDLGKTGEVFLKGDETSGVTKFDQVEDHTHSESSKVQYNTGTNNYKEGGATGLTNSQWNASTSTGGMATGTAGSTTEPRSMTVVYIIKIK